MIEYTDISSLLNNSTSDKNTSHKYGILYDLIFNSQYIKTQRKLKILEIGVSLFGGGGSVLPFSSAGCVDKYVGIDINPYTHHTIPNNAMLYCGQEYNAYSDHTINFLKEKEGLFDIIIDDGPHKFRTQIWFLNNYIKLLNPGGVLVCEDINQKHIESLMRLTQELNLYTIDLRINANKNRNEILALRYK